MTSLLDMSEAHLLNVQREIQILEQRKKEMDTEIEKLSEYLQGGVEAVNGAKSEAEAVLAEQTATPPNVNSNFNSITS
jgi:predicted phage-related endonuclease